MVASISVWRGWEEWEGTYALLFALDDHSARLQGVERVAMWRNRGHVPLAVETTSSLVELELMDATPANVEQPVAPSDQAVRLMYAMVIIRLVNGVVDPLQQKARAQSVQRLAVDVQLPSSLVEVRHEATHNRLPSLAVLRIAAQQAMLWLHEHYWLPQRTQLRALPEQVADCLHTFRRPGQRRWRVMACVKQLARLLHWVQLEEVLLPVLLDDGFLVPGLDDATPVEQRGSPEAGQAAGQQRHWLLLLRRLQQLWPGAAIGGCLLLACVRRLAAEGGCTSSERVGWAMSADQQASSRLDALHAWALLLLVQPAARAPVAQRAALRVDSRHLVTMSHLVAPSADPRCADLLRRALRRQEWPRHLVLPAKRLCSLQLMASALRSGRGCPSLGGGEPDHGCVPTPTVWYSQQRPSVASHAAGPGAPGGAGSSWTRCESWSPVALGALPLRPRPRMGYFEDVEDGSTAGSTAAGGNDMQMAAPPPAAAVPSPDSAAGFEASQHDTPAGQLKQLRVLIDPTTS